MAKVIKVDGTEIEVQPKNGRDFELDEIKTLLGLGEDDLIQTVPICKRLMVCDEEGKLKGLPINEKATEMAHAENALFPWDYYVGDVLVCNSNQIE